MLPRNDNFSVETKPMETVYSIFEILENCFKFVIAENLANQCRTFHFLDDIIVTSKAIYRFRKLDTVVSRL